MKFLLKILSRLKLLKYFNLSVKINHTYIPILGGIGYTNVYSSEKWMSEILKKLLLKTNHCFIDVGVNLGQTLIKLKEIEPERNYFGFEPNPICIYYTEKLIKKNKFKNCKIIPAGVSNKTEILDLQIFDEQEADPMASIMEDFKVHAKSEKAILVTDPVLVSDFANTKIGLIKIDVEGAELFVLEGFLNLIQRDRPFILMEILPAYTGLEQYEGRFIRQNQIEKHLSLINYTMIRILKNHDGTLKELSFIYEIGKQTDYNFSDYLFIPKEHSGIIN